MTPARPFRILTVCTGNICRSPMAERLLQAGLDAVSPNWFSVESAGTGALAGASMDPRVAGFVRVFGGVPDGFVSRQLTEDILEGQDLILALTREHRSRIVELMPAMLRRTFTLRELARLLPNVDADGEANPAERWVAASERALRNRTRHNGVPCDDDVVDPYRHDDSVYQQMMHQLSPAVRTLIAWERSFALTDSPTH